MTGEAAQAPEFSRRREKGVTPAAIEAAMIETLQSMACTPGALRREATLSELDIDSLDLVELTQVLDEEYGVAVTATRDLGELRTIGQVIDCLMAWVQGDGAH